MMFSPRVVFSPNFMNSDWNLFRRWIKISVYFIYYVRKNTLKRTGIFRRLRWLELEYNYNKILLFNNIFFSQRVGTSKVFPGRLVNGVSLLFIRIDSLKQLQTPSILHWSVEKPEAILKNLSNDLLIKTSLPCNRYQTVQNKFCL